MSKQMIKKFLVAGLAVAALTTGAASANAFGSYFGHGYAGFGHGHDYHWGYHGYYGYGGSYGCYYPSAPWWGCSYR